MGLNTKYAEQRKKLRIFLRTRGRNYRDVFSGEVGDWVINDIARDAKVNAATFEQDERKQTFNLGYRACAMRIVRILNLTPEQIDRMTDVHGDNDE